MIKKPERIIKRIIKASGERQSILLIGSWTNELISGIKEKHNSITYNDDHAQILPFVDNSFTKIVADYSSPIFDDNAMFFKEIRRLLLPTGMIIISANCDGWIFERLGKFFKKNNVNEDSVKKIKPKVLQDQIHDNGFLIDGYYGYPDGHLLMMAEIQNKEVTTLFSSERQETIIN